jgi:hypothetical protein
MEIAGPFFKIGSSESQHLTVTPLYRPHETSQDFWDGNWLESKVDIRVGGFRGHFRASLRAEEFQRFKDQFAELYQDLKGSAEFSSLEDWLTVRVKGDGLGHFEAKCQAMDEAGTGNRLEFRLAFDQTDIPAMVKGLEQILEAFPVRENSDA